MSGFNLYSLLVAIGTDEEWHGRAKPLQVVEGVFRKDARLEIEKDIRKLRCVEFVEDNRIRRNSSKAAENIRGCVAVNERGEVGIILVSVGDTAAQ